MNAETPISELAGPDALAVERKVQSFDVRSRMLLSAAQLRKMRAHQEGFVQSAAARLSVHLRAEVSLKLANIETISYQRLARAWNAPSHFTLFKMEPLRGVCVLDISPGLGASFVDRLMGGSGHAGQPAAGMSEIEKVLLEQVAQLFLEEWCARWAGIKELNPHILGAENNGAYIQAGAPDTIMLVITLQGGLGGAREPIQLAAHFPAMEPLIQAFCATAEAKDAAATPAKPAPAKACRWNECFNDVCVPVTAEWSGLEMTARQILALKVGDVLKLSGQSVQQVNVRVAENLKFQGRPGTQAGQWAVQLTKVIKS